MLETYVRTRLAVEDFVRRQADVATRSEYRWVWLVLIGILVIAAAVAWVYCRNAGYRGFSGHIEAVKGPFGIKIGIKLGCY
ncbi:MAG TPA: hypothetical protein PLF56_09855 [Micropruina sp.]|nr:hypothetical protein [Micropruina sp.]